MVTHPPRAEGSDTQAMLALYRARAAHSDKELTPFEPLRVAAIERLQLQPGQTVLDVGCGTGLSLAPLLQRLGPQGRIVGIEQCPDMLARARERLAPAQRPQVKLVQASAEDARWRGQADAALYSISSLDGLDRPWSGLEQRLKDFEVTPEWMGGVYIASGVLAGPAQRQPRLRQ